MLESRVRFNKSLVPRAVITHVVSSKRPSVRRSRWSKWACDKRIRSIRGSSSNLSAGAVRRFGPMVTLGKRIPTRGKRTGSVSIVRPKKLMRTVECPSHASVTCVSRHFDGSGLAKAGAIGRQLSIVHSLKRCPSQRRARDVRGLGCSGVFMRKRNTHFGSRISRLGSPEATYLASDTDAYECGLVSGGHSVFA